MKPCPLCGQLMPLAYGNGKRRVVCSLPCSWRLIHIRATEVDPVVVSRLIDGDYTGYATAAEHHQAIAVLTRSGLSAAQIADRVHVTTRTVVRHRHALRSAA